MNADTPVCSDPWGITVANSQRFLPNEKSFNFGTGKAGAEEVEGSSTRSMKYRVRRVWTTSGRSDGVARFYGFRAANRLIEVAFGFSKTRMEWKGLEALLDCRPGCSRPLFFQPRQSLDRGMDRGTINVPPEQHFLC